MSGQEDDAAFAAHLRQFRMAQTPAMDPSLERARRAWAGDRPIRTWAWMLPYAAAAMLALDAGISHVIGLAGADTREPDDAVSHEVETAMAHVAPAPIASDPAISLSMLESHLETGP